MGLAARAIKYLKKNGIKSFYPRFRRYFGEKSALKYYYGNVAISEDEAVKQRQTSFGYDPKVSIIIPLYNTPVKFFNELIKSIENQTYSNWELCLADGTAKETEITRICNRLMEKDKRIKYKLLEENEGISGNTNRALKMATGEFIMLADHDDLLEWDALYECVKALNENPEIDSIYSDEDKIDMEGKKHFEPHFKPDYNIEYLRTNNYICHIFFTRREIAIETGGFKKECDGAQDFDFILKCTEKSRVVHHIPKILYHWRCHRNSTAGNPESKMYAWEAGAKALREHYKRCGIDATVDVEGIQFGYYETKRNNVSKEDVYIVSERDVKKVNNIIRNTNSEYILLLDKDIKIGDNTISKMLEYAVDDNNACVTCRISDADNKLIQGPIMLGAKGLYNYSFCGEEITNPGYFRRALLPQNVTLTDYRCVMIRNSHLKEYGFFDENLPLGLAVFDYNLAMEKEEFLSVLTTYSTVEYTGENKIPKYDENSKKYFKKKWSERIKEGDRYYNRNFNLNKYLFR